MAEVLSQRGVNRRSVGDSLDAGDLGNMLAQILFDPHFEGHAARWAPHTRAVETDADQACIRHIDQFEVPAV